MLTRIREGTSSWPAKIFLGLLALSFVGWGVGDIFISRGDTTVAEVGPTEIDIRDLELAYRTQIQQFHGSGMQIEPGSDLALAMARIALDNLVLDALQNTAADTFGITIGTETLASDMQGNGLFHDASGVFSPARFGMTLQNSGLTESRYLAILSNRLRETQFINSIGAAPPPPTVLVDNVFSHRQEQRVAELAVIPNTALVPDPQPEGNDLVSFFEDNISNYAAPEYRTADYLLVYPEDLAETMVLSREQVRAVYDEAPEVWTTPEQRHLQQISYPTREEADAAYESLQDGADFAQTAFDTTGVEAEALNFGWVSRNDLFDALADPVFAAPLGEATPPLESPIGGWLIFRTTEIEPEIVTPFEEAQPEIEAQMKLRQAREDIYTLAFDLDDLVASGATVAETAEEIGLTYARIERVAKNGTFEDPLSLDALPTAPEFLDEIFFGEPDFASPVIETNDGGLLVVEVTEIVDARLRDFDEVEDRVLADWHRNQLARLAAESARAIADAAGPMGDLTAAFSETGVTFDAITPVRRTETPGIPNVGLDLVSALFEVSPGDTVVVGSTDGSAQVVARLLDIVAADALADSEGYAGVRTSLTNGLVSDIVDQETAALVNGTSVSVDQEMIEQFF
ncbi:MAG: peptidyl-prolyl cis-trans isomerase [Rhodospirillales bacterium]|nr:peptidyl-prolyl cis-trans isomerase [Rhodospirillales bacterium]